MAAKWSLKKREEASIALERSLRKGSGAGNEIEVLPKLKRKGKRAKRREAEEELNAAMNQEGGDGGGAGTSADEDECETAVTDANNFKICMSYTNLLFFDFIGKQEIVVVEQPWLDVVGKLGEVKDRKVYGA